MHVSYPGAAAGFSSSSSFSSADFRAALGMFATGVTIVTTRCEDGLLHGLTVNSFNSVSLAPPLVLWSLSRQASSLPVFNRCSHYAVNVLAADQLVLAQRFAQRGVNRFAGLQLHNGAGGAPLIAGCVASFECRNRNRHEEGDHVIFIGEVEHCTRHSGAAPLLYHGGKFYTELELSCAEP